MNCRKARSFILALYDDELSHSTRKELLKHIESCTRCQKDKLLLEQMKAGVHALPKDRLSDNFNNNLFAKIYSAPRTEATKVSPAPTAVAYYFKSLAPYLTAVVCVVFLAWVGINQLLISTERDSMFTEVSPEDIIDKVNQEALPEQTNPYRTFTPQNYTNIQFSAGKLDSLQIAASLKSNRLLLNRMRLDAARNFGGFNQSNCLVRENNNNNQDTTQKKYIYPVVRNANINRNPY